MAQGPSMCAQASTPMNNVQRSMFTSSWARIVTMKGFAQCHSARTWLHGKSTHRTQLRLNFLTHKSSSVVNSRGFLNILIIIINWSLIGQAVAQLVSSISDQTNKNEGEIWAVRRPPSPLFTMEEGWTRRMAMWILRAIDETLRHWPWP